MHIQVMQIQRAIKQKCTPIKVAKVLTLSASVRRTDHQRVYLKRYILG